MDNEIISLIVDGSTDFAGMKALVSRQNYRMSRRLDADRSSLTANDPAPLPTPASGGITELGQLPIRQHVGGLTQEDETLTAEFNIASPAASASPTDAAPASMYWRSMLPSSLDGVGRASMVSSVSRMVS